MRYTQFFVYLTTGLMLGLFYYHHLWLEVWGLRGNRLSPFLRFWVRFSALSFFLAFWFFLVPDSGLFIATGVILAKPLYIVMKKKSIFGV